MTNFLQLSIEGFCSVVNPVTIPLNMGGIVRITGPNGVGKTTMLSALVYCLFGKTIKGVSDVNTWRDLRPKDYPGTKVEVTWQSENGVYKVIRCQNYTPKLDDGAKGGSRLLFYIDGNLTQTKGKIAIQNEINKSLGFSYELFINSIMFGQGMKRLIQESNVDKKKLFEEIFKLDYLNTARVTATNERNYIYSLSKDVSSEVNHIEDKIESETETYEDIKKQQREFKDLIKHEKTHLTDELAQINGQLDNLESKIDLEVEPNYNKYSSKLTKLKKELKKANTVRNIPVIDVVNDVLALMNKQDYKKAYDKLFDIRKTFIKCNKLENEIDQVSDKVGHYQKLLRSQDRFTGEIKRLKAQQEKLRFKIKNLVSKNPPELDTKFRHKIFTLKKKLTTLKAKQKEIEKQLEDYNWVINDPLSNKGLKAFLFDSCLTQLNHNLEKFSDTLGFRVEFNVDLDSSTKGFVTLIEKDGVIAEYEELSGGEKALVNLTMCLALHETLTLSKDVNILLLDEVFENLCRDNIELVIALIRDLSQTKTIYLITHLESLTLGNCRNLVVSKENGLTNYMGI